MGDYVLSLPDAGTIGAAWPFRDTDRPFTKVSASDISESTYIMDERQIWGLTFLSLGVGADPDFMKVRQRAVDI